MVKRLATCKRSQHCWANNVGSGCVRLHVALALTEGQNTVVMVGGGGGRGKALFSLRKYTLSERRNVFEGSVSTILSPTVASLWRASKLHHASKNLLLLKLNTLSVLYVLLIPTDKSKRKFAACKSI